MTRPASPSVAQITRGFRRRFKLRGGMSGYVGNGFGSYVGNGFGSGAAGSSPNIFAAPPKPGAVASPQDTSFNLTFLNPDGSVNHIQVGGATYAQSLIPIQLQTAAQLPQSILNGAANSAAIVSKPLTVALSPDQALLNNQNVALANQFNTLAAQQAQIATQNATYAAQQAAIQQQLTALANKTVLPPLVIPAAPPLQTTGYPGAPPTIVPSTTNATPPGVVPGSSVPVVTPPIPVTPIAPATTTSTGFSAWMASLTPTQELLYGGGAAVVLLMMLKRK